MLEKFIEENFERDVNSFVKSKDLHKMYLKFAEENGLPKISQKALTFRLNDLRIGAVRSKTIKGETFYARYGLKVK